MHFLYSVSESMYKHMIRQELTILLLSLEHYFYPGIMLCSGFFIQHNIIKDGACAPSINDQHLLQQQLRQLLSSSNASSNNSNKHSYTKLHLLPESGATLPPVHLLLQNSSAVMQFPVPATLFHLQLINNTSFIISRQAQQQYIRLLKRCANLHALALKSLKII